MRRTPAPRTENRPASEVAAVCGSGGRRGSADARKLGTECVLTSHESEAGSQRLRACGHAQASAIGVKTSGLIREARDMLDIRDSAARKRDAEQQAAEQQPVGSDGCQDDAMA